MKILWLVLLLLSIGCAAMETVGDNLTSPAAAKVIDKTLDGLPGPGGVDLGDVGIGGAVVSLIGLLAKLFGTNKRIDKTKGEVDENWEEVKRLREEVAVLRTKALETVATTPTLPPAPRPVG